MAYTVRPCTSAEMKERKFNHRVKENNMSNSMKKISVLLVSLAGLGALSGCVAYPVAYDNGPHYRQAPPPAQGYRRDRDGDGVPNRADRRPSDPHRY